MIRYQNILGVAFTLGFMFIVTFQDKPNAAATTNKKAEVNDTAAASAIVVTTAAVNEDQGIDMTLVLDPQSMHEIYLCRISFFLSSLFFFSFCGRLLFSWCDPLLNTSWYGNLTMINISRRTISRFISDITCFIALFGFARLV